VITIIDSGGANLSSVMNAFEKLGQKAELSSDPDRIFKSAKVVLPGVGAAANAMDRLKLNGLDCCIKELKQPVLGICLGMQLLFTSSEEGPTRCLEIIPGRVVHLSPRMPSGQSLTVPHMGWDQVVYENSAPSPLFKGIGNGEFFYFVHSYAAGRGDWVRAYCEYGQKVTAAVERGNFFGVQFHPERSSKAGARLLSNFLSL